jgi:rhodanese-related sulfurtransferase
MAREIDRFEVMRLREQGAQVVEVLPRREYEKRHIPGAISLPLGQLAARARRQLDPDRPVVAYRYDSLCDLSGRAAARLESLCFIDVYNYQSSKVDWFANSLPAAGTEVGMTRLADLADRGVPRWLGETAAGLRSRIGDREPASWSTTTASCWAWSGSRRWSTPAERLTPAVGSVPAAGWTT